MTIYKQPGSPYYYYDFYFERRRYQASTHLRNKTVAHRVECIKKAELAQRRAGILPKKQIPLFRDFAERFLHTVSVERRRNTHRAYLSCVRNLEPIFGRKYLDEITPEMIRAFKEARLEQQRSPATINRDLSCLRQILGIAVKEELIQKSLFFGGRVEFLHEKGRERILSFDEERKYINAAAPVLRDVAMIMVEMGLRPGEIFQLCSEDVRVERPAPHVHVRQGSFRLRSIFCQRGLISWVSEAIEAEQMSASISVRWWLDGIFAYHRSIGVGPISLACSAVEQTRIPLYWARCRSGQ
jgi:hypothetical protein